MTLITGDIIIPARLTTIRNFVTINGIDYEIEDIGNEISFDEYCLNIYEQLTPQQEKEGIDITRVQVLARHENIATTNIYTHLNPKFALEEFDKKF